MRVCREAVIRHMESDPAVGKEGAFGISPTTLGPSQASGRVDHDKDSAAARGFLVTPTIITRGYAEFKFASMKIVFGVVFYTHRKDYNRFLITHSRNCHFWEPIREKEGYGDAKVTCWHAMMHTHIVRVCVHTHTYIYTIILAHIYTHL